MNNKNYLITICAVLLLISVIGVQTGHCAEINLSGGQIEVFREGVLNKSEYVYIGKRSTKEKLLDTEKALLSRAFHDAFLCGTDTQCETFYMNKNEWYWVKFKPEFLAGISNRAYANLRKTLDKQIIEGAEI